MSFSETLRAVHAIAARAAFRRGAVVCALGVLERLLAPLLVLPYVVGQSVGLTVVASAALIFVVWLKGFVQRRSAIEAEGETQRAVVNAVLASDVLDSSVLRHEEAQSAIVEAVHRVGVLVGETLPNWIASLVATAVLVIALPLFAGSAAALTAAGAFAVAGLVLLGLRRIVDRRQQRAWRAWSELGNGLSDACDGRLEIVASGRTSAFTARFHSVTTTWEGLARAAAMVSALMGRIPVAIVAGGVGVVVLLEAHQEGLGWAQALIRAGLLATSAPALIGIGTGFQAITDGARRVELVAEVLRRAPSAPVGGDAPPEKVALVELQNIDFTYGERPVLADVSFELSRGKLLVLAGSNGSGKTTCLRVLVGLAVPSRGEVLVDGQPLSKLDVDAWRREIAFLPQRPFFPERATIRDALRFLDERVTETRMRAALDRVGLAKALRDVDDMLDVYVTDLSAGARQRLALARVLCSDGQVFVLDEPDANLDKDGTAILAEVLKELASDHLVIVAAHARELHAVAHTIVTLDEGRVISSSG
nr:vitamin B12 import ATP-binding protein BtuD [uncultured bacterium]